MKLVFLDIDGVLNAEGQHYPEQEHALDPLAIQRLNRLCAESGADVVLTTTWRLFYPWPECGQLLARHGLTAPVIGETRDLWEEDEDAAKGRRREIEDWIARHPVPRFAVLDDLEVFPAEARYFVRTLEREGLSDADVARALAWLRGPTAEPVPRDSGSPGARR